MQKDSIQCEPTGDGIRVRLPNRSLKDVAKIGWVAVVFGSFGVLFMLAWISGPVTIGVKLLQQGGPAGWMPIAFGMFGLFGLYGTTKIAVFGLCLVRNRIGCEVTVDSKQVISREIFGWFSHSTKISRTDIDGLFLVSLLAGHDAIDSNPRPSSALLRSILGAKAADLFAIRTRKRTGKMIAMGYPRETLETVAESIAVELNRNANQSTLISRNDYKEKKSEQESTPTIRVQYLSEGDLSSTEIELPEDSDLQVLQQDGSTVYRIPRRSVWKSGGVFFFAIIWNAMVAFFTGVVIWGLFNGANQQNNVNNLPVFVLVISIFWLVGLSFLGGTIYSAWQSALIGVKDGLLFIERKTIFGTSWSDFTAEQIVSIEMGHANMEVNGRPVMNLQITPREGRTVALFSRLSNGELQWLARQLQQTLGIRPKAELVSHSRRTIPEEPARTDIRIHRDADQLTIFVPPRDVPGGRGLRIVLPILMSLALPLTIALTIMNAFEPFILIFGVMVTLISSASYICLRIYTSRKFTIVRSDSMLQVVREGFLSDYTFEVANDHVLSIKAADSGAKSNNKTMFLPRD